MKHDIIYLQHIIDASKFIEKYVAHGKEAFLSDDMIQNATIKVLANISESAGHLKEETRSEYRQISWSKVKSFRNFLVHDYLGDIDFELVWNIAHKDLLELVCVAKKILEEKYNL